MKVTDTDTWVGRERQSYLPQLRLAKQQQTVRQPTDYGKESATIVSNTKCLGHKDTPSTTTMRTPIWNTVINDSSYIF